jgi:hypothetical protein
VIQWLHDGFDVHVDPRKARQIVNLILQLEDPHATDLALKRLRYWRDHPLNEWSGWMFDDSLDEVRNRGMLHFRLHRLDDELKVAKRLNLVMLWESAFNMVGSPQDPIKMAKVIY